MRVAREYQDFCFVATKKQIHLIVCFFSLFYLFIMWMFLNKQAPEHVSFCMLNLNFNVILGVCCVCGFLQGTQNSNNTFHGNNITENTALQLCSSAALLGSQLSKWSLIHTESSSLVMKDNIFAISTFIIIYIQQCTE